MSIEIIGTESLGVRGMCCVVKVRHRMLVIDPGVALGYTRHGLMPHPLQVAAGVRVRNEIVRAVKSATDIVFSHFHGDHVPLFHANPYQLSFDHIFSLRPGLRVWAMSAEGLSAEMHRRAEALHEYFGPAMCTVDGDTEGIMSFSGPVPHGLPDSRCGTVMMTRLDVEGEVFVHASDIQFLHAATIDKILLWEPDTVFASGPPLYLQTLTSEMRKHAWENGIRIARNVRTLIVDHHLLRSRAGVVWLENMSQKVGKKVYCAADFMNQQRLFLEAERRELYERSPVAPNWHEKYAQGLVRAS